MEKVALLKCCNYDVDKIEDKIREGFEYLGGEDYIRSIIKEGSNVLLKPNMLSVEEKGSATITNYMLFEAVIRVIKPYAASISFGDSPGFGDARRAAEKGGFMEVANRYGVTFVDFNDAVNVKQNNSLLNKTWNVARAAYESHVLITLPKLKTHAMAFYTGAVKNQFGCIPGTQKATWHTRIPDANNFCKMLLDLNKLVNTSFAILDGIVAMEGNGPKSGTPKALNTIIMGENINSVDSIATYIIGYNNPLVIPTLKEAYEADYKGILHKDICVLGEDVEQMKCKDFKLCRSGGDFNFINPNATKFLRSMITPSPVLTFDKCISCGRCLEVCPEKGKVLEMVIKKGKKIPKWKMSNCIRCFCCQELCPVGAITLKQTTLGKLLKKSKR